MVRLMRKTSQNCMHEDDDMGAEGETKQLLLNQ